MSRQSYHFYLAIYLVSLYIVSGTEKNCDPGSLNDCGEHWRCVEKRNGSERGTCECDRGYELVKNECILQLSIESSTSTLHSGPDPKTSSRGRSVVAGLLIPTFLILLGAVMYYGARRYKWIQRFRQFRQNRYGNVLVTRDETDDDDPPIA